MKPKRNNKKSNKNCPSSVTADLHITRTGVGYVIDETTNRTIWIERPDLGTALPGDTVVVAVKNFSRSKTDSVSAGGKFAKDKWGKGRNIKTNDALVEIKPNGHTGLEGRIVRIEARVKRSFVGTVVSSGRFSRVKPLSSTFREEFIVNDLRDAEIGDRVLLKLSRWDNPRLAPEGKILEVIGPAVDASLDTLAVMKQYELPEEFPDEVIQEAERVGDLHTIEGALKKKRSTKKTKKDDTKNITETQNEKREDLRRKFIFTCDPKLARDFDDALSLDKDKQGRRVLGVHIADVSHYVPADGVLDIEARKRSTSVYLIDHVVPMLPEQLSNGVCSLVPNQDRLAFSVFLTFDETGKCVEQRFVKSVIRSKARLDYEELKAILSGKKSSLSPTHLAKIRAINKLAQQMRANRFASGALRMDVPEAEITLDKQGEMVDITTRAYDESHQLIEECMVAANEAVARVLWTRGIKILTRLHEAPDLDRLEELRGNLSKLGVSCGDLSKPSNMSAFLDKIRNTPLEGVISVMVLKSMKRAIYSADTMGHFGLAKDYYAHFTSPIRRYPDLVLHRQLAAWIAGKNANLDQKWLRKTAEHCSLCEQNADEAERMLIEIKKFRFLQAVVENKVPNFTNCFDAVISKCTRYGIFVDVPGLMIGGMIHIAKLCNEYAAWNEWNQSFSTRNRVWAVGTKMRVRVMTVDFDKRMLDFEPVEEEEQKDNSKLSNNKKSSKRAVKTKTNKKDLKSRKTKSVKTDLKSGKTALKSRKRK